METKQKSISFMHLRRTMPLVYRNPDFSMMDLNPFGGVTVAFREMGDGDFQVALGRCRNDERYVRKLGRDAATRNLLMQGAIVHIEDAECSDSLYDALVDYAKRHAHRNLRIERRAHFAQYKEKEGEEFPFTLGD